MALPLGEAGVQQIDKEEPLLSMLQSSISAHGLYMFPKMAPGTAESEYQKKVATGSSGMVIYFPSRDFGFGKALAIEFVTQLIQTLIAVAVVAPNISYWNWYGSPVAYTCAYMFTEWVGYICAGLVAAAMKIGGPRTA